MSESVKREVLPKVDCLWQKVDTHLELCGNLGVNAMECKPARYISRDRARC